VVLWRGRSSGEVKKGRATAVVRGGEVILGPISGQNLWINPSILEYETQKSTMGEGHTSRGLKQALKRIHQIPQDVFNCLVDFPVLKCR
jgi:hypothetical protein